MARKPSRNLDLSDAARAICDSANVRENALNVFVSTMAYITLDCWRELSQLDAHAIGYIRATFDYIGYAGPQDITPMIDRLRIVAGPDYGRCFGKWTMLDMAALGMLRLGIGNNNPVAINVLNGVAPE